MQIALVGLRYGYIGGMRLSAQNSSDVECVGLTAVPPSPVALRSQ